MLAGQPGVSHRVKPVDLLGAAVAYREASVLDYDADYDLLAERTDLVFESIWAAARGSAG